VAVVEVTVDPPLDGVAETLTQVVPPSGDTSNCSVAAKVPVTPIATVLTGDGYEVDIGRKRQDVPGFVVWHVDAEE
jgi:hypothetical protein